jgi:hypothetical protein
MVFIERALSGWKYPGKPGEIAQDVLAGTVRYHKGSFTLRGF